MSRSFPVNPSIIQLKKQAKELRSAFVGGQAQALALVTVHLPRLQGG